MKVRIVLTTWKYPFILLFGIGISNFGAWIYFIALNLIVLEMTNSPMAVAGLYIVKPIAALLTNGWAGSVIDRMNKRHVIIILDFVRMLFIASLPLTSSVWFIYLIVLVINMASSIFEPAAMTYITKLIPIEKRQRFNSFKSLIDSGAFLVGPAIAGILFMLGTPTTAIYINAAALLLSGLVTLMMPNLERYNFTNGSKTTFSWKVIKEDWNTVLSFSHTSSYVMLLFFLFNCMMIMTAAIDSQEAAFAKAVLSLTDSEYGFLVSIAGAGIVMGAIVNTLLVKKLKISLLIGGGSLMVSAGYLIYAFSHSFTAAAVGFFLLAFSLAFANTGFYTFSQNNIPVEIMGRIVSIYGLIEAILIIITTVTIGLTAQWISIQLVVIAATFVMLIFSIMLFMLSLKPTTTNYYSTAEIKQENSS